MTSNVECDCGDTAEYYYHNPEHLIAICHHCNNTLAGKFIVKLKNLQTIDQETYLKYQKLSAFK